jgi:signal transduction histidine kinase
MPLRIRCRVTARRVGGAVAAAGSLGWLAATCLPTRGPVSGAAAVALMLGGASLHQTLGARPWSRRLGLASAVGMLTLAVWSFGVRASGESPASAPWWATLLRGATAVLGEPIAPLAAFDLLLLGGALLLQDTHEASRWPAGQVLAFAAIIVALLSVYGRLYRLTWFVDAPAAADVPWIESVVLIALSGGILLARADRGFMSVFTGEGPAGVMVRRLVPAVVAGPWGLGWLTLALHRVWPDESPLAVVQILAASTIALLSGLVIHSAFVVEDSDRRRRTVERALHQSEKRLNAIVNGSFDGILIHDGQRVVDASDTLVAMLGLEATDAARGRPLATLFEQPVCLPATHGTKIARRVQGCGRRGRRFLLEVVCHDYWDGERPLHVAALRDCTEIQRLENRLRQTQQVELLGRLANTIVHDVNNALTVVLGCADDLRDDPVVRGRQHRVLAEMIKAAEAAGQMLARVRTFARPDAAPRERITIQAFLREVEPLLLRTIGPGIALEVTVDPRTPALDADPAQLLQILLNLAINARDAMPEGGRLRIAARGLWLDVRDREPDFGTLAPGSYVLLEVSDTGHGIPAEALPCIFDPFFTTKPPGKGTGLGLASVLSIARQHGGAVGVDSAPGRGATFRVALPATGAVPERRRSTA